MHRPAPPFSATSPYKLLSKPLGILATASPFLVVLYNEHRALGAGSLSSRLRFVDVGAAVRELGDSVRTDRWSRDMQIHHNASSAAQLLTIVVFSLQVSRPSRRKRVLEE